MKSIYDNVSFLSSRLITKTYSTSFSLGISFLDRSLHKDIYAIYGFVRLADEIVDSFEGYEQANMLLQIRRDVEEAIANKISINPILNAFQHTVNKYDIEKELIDQFLYSMELDLKKQEYDQQKFEEYIFGSAEVVGLMCLRVFVQNDDPLYQKLKPFAMKLGSAFQKVNFLRDLQADYETLGRSYFPDIDLENFTAEQKKKIENDIQEDFELALLGIAQLPNNCKQGVYLAYIYYYKLFRKITYLKPNDVMSKRIRISNSLKILLMFVALFKSKLRLV